MGLRDAARRALERQATSARYNDSFEGLRVVGDQLFRVRAGKQWPVADCSATVDAGAAIAARVTATRVAAGAALAGPLGALVGALAKKDRSRVYLAVTTSDDHILLEVDGKDEADARRFAASVNAAAAHFGASDTQARR